VIQQLKKPTRDVIDDFDLVCSARKSRQTREILSEVRRRVLDAYKDYDSGGDPLSGTTPLELKDEAADALRGNYLHTYPKKKLAQLRSEITSSTPFELCAMCSKGAVAALDHYLPKDKFPEFSILAFNLVPVCDRCNDKKATLVGNTDGRFFHAYYDRMPETPSLLTAAIEVVHDCPVASFNINERLPRPLYENAIYQFEKLCLAEVYMGAATQELVDRLLTFDMHYRLGGAEAVAHEARRQSKHLRKEFGSQYWKAALYDAIEVSDDFCNGGFSTLVTNPSSAKV
jgi:hypothetical protein